MGPSAEVSTHTSTSGCRSDYRSCRPFGIASRPDRHVVCPPKFPAPLRVWTCERLRGYGVTARRLAVSDKRTLSANGLLTEIVHLDGGREGLSDPELQYFVSGFPITAG